MEEVTINEEAIVVAGERWRSQEGMTGVVGGGKGSHKPDETFEYHDHYR